MALQASSIALAFGSEEERAQSPEIFWTSACSSLHPSRFISELCLGKTLPFAPVVTVHVCRNLVALVLGQKLAVLAAQGAELDQRSGVSFNACNFPEQITTLCWLAYATPDAGMCTLQDSHVCVLSLPDCAGVQYTFDATVSITHTHTRCS